MEKKQKLRAPFKSSIMACAVGKPCYDKKTAMTVKNNQWRKMHVKLRVYECHVLNAWTPAHWHVTSRADIFALDDEE